jgi:hypothetical protein
MYLLGHERRIRRGLGFPDVDRLWGRTGQCAFLAKGRAGSAKLAAEKLSALVVRVRTAPDEVVDEIKGDAAQAIKWVDEFMVHTDFGAAHELASYLACVPALARRVTSSSTGDDAVAYLKLKAILADVEGGAYDRARAQLLQVSAQVDRGRHGELRPLLQANVELLWGRLLQLQWLHVESRKRLDAARALFAPRFGVPDGFALLEYRSRLQGGWRDHGREVPELTAPAEADPRNNLWGGLYAHYHLHLRTVAELNRDHLADAAKLVSRSTRMIVRDGHPMFPDPIRLGYATLCRGRALSRQGLMSGGSTLAAEEGIALLNEARWAFRSREFVPGEYLAYNDYLETRMALDTRTEAAQDKQFWVPLLKESKRLGQRSGVPLFRLEAGLRYAQALIDTGRLNAARDSVQDLSPIGEGPLEQELKDSRLYRDAAALIAWTKDARTNAVDPREPWGISTYAIVEELSFVKSLVDNQNAGPVSVYAPHAPSGCGRRIFINRLIEARRQAGRTREVGGDRFDAQEALHVIRLVLRDGGNVILYELDTWQPRLHAAVAGLLEKHPAWCPRVYATITVPALQFETVAPTLGRLFLPECTFEVKPLSERPNDKLLLARGSLIRELLRRPVGRARTDRILDPRKIVFTGQCCAQLRARDIGIGELNTAMRLLARRLRPSRDVIFVANGVVKVTAEALERHLWAQVPRREPITRAMAERKVPSTSGALPGAEIKYADAAKVAQLATRYSSLSRLASDAGLGRTTLIEAWKRGGVMKIWQAAQHQRRGAFSAPAHEVTTEPGA